MPVMTEQAYKSLIHALPFPVYVFTETQTGYYCDQLTVADEAKKEFGRNRFIITGTTQCTCLGWMKHKACNHTAMLREDFDFVGRGVSSEVATIEGEKLIDSIKATYDEAEAIVASSAEEISAVIVRIPKGPKNVKLIIGVKVFPEHEGRKLALGVRVSDE